MTNKVINLLLKVENVLCVYRNYTMFPRKYRILANLRMLLELSFTIVTTVSVFHNPPSMSTFAKYLLSIVNALIIILSARWYSKAFKKLLEYIEGNHINFSPDSVYLNILDKKYKSLKIIFLFCVILTIIFLYFHFGVDKIPLELAFLIFHINISICNIRYTIEYIVMFTILHVLTEHVKCICRGVDEKVKYYERVSENEIEKKFEQEDCFRKWTIAYRNIKESSNLFNHIFGFQMTVILLSSMLYFIIILYEATSSTISGSSGIQETTIFYSLKFIIYIISLFMLTRSAHALQSSAECLRRHIAKLLIYCPLSHVSYWATKDLLKLVADRNLKTRAFRSLTIDMRLLPSSIMFFTSYTIIALQFNNVV